MDAQDISRYRSWLLANPSAFVEGVLGFCKQAQYMPQQRMAPVQRQDDDDEDDNRSLWDRMKPWVIGLGAGYVGLKGGEWWGRYAQSRGYRQGPVKGPFVALANGLLPRNLKVQGTTTRQERANAQG